MKKLLFSVSVFLVFVVVTKAQAPAFINYQGVARNSAGNALVNKTIGLRLTIRDYGGGGPSGIPVFTETRTVTTNAFGLFNVQVGGAGGTNVTGTILGINWKLGPKFMQVEIDTEGGTSFTDIGTTRLTSVPYALYANQVGDLVLPFIKSQNEEAPLFKITNTGNNINSLSYEGLSNSTANNAAAIRGIITSVSPGGFSAGVVGQNNGTGANGIGVFGNQNGTGWGVYGTTPGGVGVYGNSTNGMGVYGQSVTGPSVMGFQPGTGTSNAGYFQNFNQNNTAGTLRVFTNGLGDGLNVNTTGFGKGAVININNTTNGATVFEAITNGFGKAGFFQNTNSLNTNNVLEAQTNGVSRAGYLQNTNASNTSNVLEVQTNGLGKVGVLQNTNAANTANALDVTTNGLSRVGFLENTNAANTSNVLEVQTNGTGKVGVLQNTNASNAANALDVRTNGLGRVGFLQNTGATNTSNVLEVQTNGTGKVGVLQNTNASNAANVLEVQTNGTGKVAVLQNTNAASANNALNVITNGTGYAAYIQNTNVNPGNRKALQVDGSVIINDSTQSTGTTSGALVISTGGLGVAGNFNVGGTSTFGGPIAFGESVAFTDPAESINPATGAVTVVGGVGIGKRLNVTGDVAFSNALSVGGATTLNGTATIAGVTTINNTLNVNASSSFIANYVNTNTNGISIQVGAATPGNANNFVEFRNSSGGVVGRIEGETLAELTTINGNYANEIRQYQADIAFGAIDVAKDGYDIVVALGDVLASTSSSTACVGLGACITTPIPSFIIGSTAKLVVAFAKEIATIAALVFTSTNYDNFQAEQAAGVGISYQSGAGDYAEYLMKAQPTETFVPGDIVGVKGGKISKNIAGAEKIMAISTKPIVLGNMPKPEDEKNYEKVAFLGQVPVKVFGKVNVGDYIIPNGNNNGVGKAVAPSEIKSTEIKNILGIAWSGASQNYTISTINVAVGVNVNDNQKMVDELQSQVSDLKNQVADMNNKLEKFILESRSPGSSSDKKNVPVTTTVPTPLQNGNAVVAPPDVSNDVIYHHLTREQILQAAEMAEKMMRESGVDISTHPFWIEYKNNPSFKEATITKIMTKVENAIQDAKKMNEKRYSK